MVLGTDFARDLLRRWVACSLLWIGSGRTRGRLAFEERGSCGEYGFECDEVEEQVEMGCSCRSKGPLLDEARR